MSIKLNEIGLIHEVIEGIPIKDGKVNSIVYFLPNKRFFVCILVELIVGGLGQKFVEKLLVIIAGALESSRHLEFYLHWVEILLSLHGMKINAQMNMPALISLQKCLSRKYEQMSKM